MDTTSASTRTPGTARIAPEEQRLRVELACLYRIIDHLGWSDLIWTHTSVRVPGPEHHFLINPYGLRFDEIRASNLVKIDLDGRRVDGGDAEFNPAGFVIHSSIHMTREDAQCVVHTHTVAGMAVAALECGLLPIGMFALGYDGQVSYHDFEGPSVETGERERMAANLGRNHVMILRNHGLLACGRTVAQAFVRMYRLERACQVQLAAQATGAKLIVPPDAVRRRSAQLSDDFLEIDGAGGQGRYSRQANPEFAAMMRLMDQKDPSYRE